MNHNANIPLTRLDVIQEARLWLEVPWRHLGRNRRGIDCAGLVIRVGNDRGLISYDVRQYPRHTHRDAFVCHFQAVLIEKPITQRQPGDILLIRDGVYACHCGIIGILNRRETLIHAYFHRGKVVEESLIPTFQLTMTHCFSYPGL